MINKFKDSFKEQTVWIIGKGPSLQYLTKEDIDPGPVITINEAIIKIEEIGLPNFVFSMQMDGGKRKRYPHKSNPDCDYTPNCGDRCGHMYRPKKGATLLFHVYQALYCFPDYSPRYVFNSLDLGLPRSTFSIPVAVKIGILMGCNRFHFVSCDSYVNGCVESYIPNIGIVGTRPGYMNQVRRTQPYLIGLDCKWITPV